MVLREVKHLVKVTQRPRCIRCLKVALELHLERVWGDISLSSCHSHETTLPQGLYPGMTLVFKQPVVSFRDSKEPLEKWALLHNHYLLGGLGWGWRVLLTAARPPVPLLCVCARACGHAQKMCQFLWVLNWPNQTAQCGSVPTGLQLWFPNFMKGRLKPFY